MSKGDEMSEVSAALSGALKILRDASKVTQTRRRRKKLYTVPKVKIEWVNSNFLEYLEQHTSFRDVVLPVVLPKQREAGNQQWEKSAVADDDNFARVTNENYILG